MATNRSWSPKDSNEKREETQWHSVVAFSKLAEICDMILQKGTKVYISGRIQNRDFTNAEGESFRRTEVVALEMIAFSKRKDASPDKSKKESSEK
jgi:single-strand DNA-binding protein